MWKAVRTRRPTFAKVDADFHANNLLTTNMEYYSFKVRAKLWAVEYFGKLGEHDIPGELVGATLKLLTESVSLSAFIKLLVQPLWPSDSVSVESIMAVCGELQQLVIAKVGNCDGMVRMVDWSQFLVDVETVCDFARNGIPVFVDPEWPLS